MNVLFIMHNTDMYSGANLAMQEVIEELPSDITKIILYPKSEGTAIEYFKNKGIKVITIPYWSLLLSETDTIIKNIIKYPLLLYRYFLMKINCVKMNKMIKDIDIIYTNTSTIKFGLMLSVKYNIPHVWHIREFADKDHRLIFPLGKRHYYSLAKKKNSYLITISECLKNEILPYFNEEKVALVYDNVQSGYINPNKKLNEKKDVNILIAGDIKEGKGQLIVVNAISILKKRGIKNINLFIAGKIGDRQYYNNIQNTIRENNINDIIHLLGHVTNMNELRRNMHIGVVASKSEAFGRVTVEGMLSNMAMIGRDTGATVELIENNVTGILYDGSAMDLADKIESLLDEKNRNKIANNGFKTAVELYASGSCSKKIAKILYKINGEKRNG